MDGTFLSHNTNFSVNSHNFEAVKRLQDEGHIFVLASGRSPFFLKTYYDMLNLKDMPMISFHGAYITTPYQDDLEGFPYLSESISAKTIKDIEEKYNLADLASSMQIVGKNKVVDFITSADVLDKLNFEVFEGVYVFDNSQVDSQEIADKILKDFGDVVNIKLLKNYGIEGGTRDYLLLVAPDVDKGRALKLLAKYYDIPRDRVAFFGDQANDLGGIKYAGTGIAVQNAIEELKENANVVLE
jgi:Cof subfamily protein (haloacid dehalogenase superfamily)